ncbi:MAG: hypothetical protein AAF682_16420 [Planctomycetota bacterium]
MSPTTNHPQPRRTRPARALVAAALLALGPASAAAQTAPEPPAALSVEAASFGIAPRAGDLLGIGPDFKAVFGPGAVEFVPALGRGVAENHPLRFALEEIRLGDAVLLDARAAAPVAPWVEDKTAVYAHPGGVEERYEVRREGVEQSFLIHALPAATDGDLIVRGELITDLPAAPADGGLAYTLPGIGGVRVGRVLAIDAEGREMQGTLRAGTDSLELVVPGDWARGAALPLLIDPLIGTEKAFGDSAQDEGKPDVAYDAATNRYLIVWERSFSFVDTDVYGQIVTSAGILASSPLALSSTTDLAGSPRVASLASGPRFIVVYQQAASIAGPWRIQARTVDPSLGSLSSALSVAGGDGTSHRSPDIGGQIVGGPSEAVVVWVEEAPLTGIRSHRIGLKPDGTPILVGAPNDLSYLTTADKPAISQSGGQTGFFIAVWQEFLSSPPPGDHDFWYAVLDSELNELEGGFLASIGPDEEEPAIDGDGKTFLLAWQQQKTAGDDEDIFTRRMIYNASGLFIGDPVQLTSGPLSEVKPCVAWSSAEYAVAWENPTGAFLESTVNLAWVDAVTGTQIDPNVAVLGAGTHAGSPAIASQFSGAGGSTAGGAGPDGDEAMLVYTKGALTLPFDNNIAGHVVEATGDGGPVLDLGGGCTGGGTASPDGPVAIGNAAFRVELNGADPSATLALLNLAAPTVPIPCGSCVFAPPGTLFTQVPVGGSAAQTVPIPNQATLIGSKLEAQWALLPTSSSPCPLFANVSLSNRLELTFDV